MPRILKNANSLMRKRRNLVESVSNPTIKKSRKKSKSKTSKSQKSIAVNDLPKKQRTLILSSRGITSKSRHLMGDLLDLLPTSRKDVKLENKDSLYVINEVADSKNCNNVIFFENKKKMDTYMWISKIPAGPSIRFLVQNIHTMEELKLTGNCLKGSRAILTFGKEFSDPKSPHLNIMRELLKQVMGTPRGEPKSKPFYDHVISFEYFDNRIWVRNYQIVEDNNIELIEIGPRFVLNPIRILSGSFGGSVIWENDEFVSPNTIRAATRAKSTAKYKARKEEKSDRAIRTASIPKSENDLADIWED